MEHSPCCYLKSDMIGFNGKAVCTITVFYTVFKRYFPAFQQKKSPVFRRKQEMGSGLENFFLIQTSEPLFRYFPHCGEPDGLFPLQQWEKLHGYWKEVFLKQTEEAAPLSMPA